jgi:hypothetical protein
MSPHGMAMKTLGRRLNGTIFGESNMCLVILVLSMYLITLVDLLDLHAAEIFD